MWDKAQELLANRQEQFDRGVYQKGSAHFLYGKVFCAQCGAPYKRRTVTNVHRSGDDRYSKVWNCKERQKGEKGNHCQNPTLHENKLLAQISLKMGWAWSDAEHFNVERFLREVERVEVMSNGEITVKRIEQAA